MHQNVCRLCGKESLGFDGALKLFERKNKKLLTQLKDLNLNFKNLPNLPKCMCPICHESLLAATQFRKNVLKVQASFKQIANRENKNSVFETTELEFVQVCYVKEEKYDLEVVEEKEINISKSQVQCKKEDVSPFNNYTDEINALDLSNEENTLDDTGIQLHKDKCIESDDTNGFILTREEDKGSIDSISEHSERKVGDNGSDIEFKSNEITSKKVKLKKARLRAKQTAVKAKSLKNAMLSNSLEKALPPKENKPRKKQKNAREQHTNLFICDQCGNHFTCRHHFKLHLRRHTGDKQCACELCPDKFFTSSELRRHMRKHTGERPFACKFCDRRFTDYSTRIKHERTHTNERPFTCSQCGKSFTTSYILKNHMLTHTGERHFKCDICNKAFTRRTHLVVHFRSIMHKQAEEKGKLKEESQRPLDTISIDNIYFGLK